MTTYNATIAGAILKVKEKAPETIHSGAFGWSRRRCEAVCTEPNKMRANGALQLRRFGFDDFTGVLPRHIFLSLAIPKPLVS